MWLRITLPKDAGYSGRVGKGILGPFMANVNVRVVIGKELTELEASFQYAARDMGLR